MTVAIVRRTAKDVAGAYYEQNRTARFRKFWPDQKQYIARNWPEFVEDARGALAEMLARNDVHQNQKDTIYEALQEDHRRQDAYRGPQWDAGRFALKVDEPGKVEQEVFYKGMDN